MMFVARKAVYWKGTIYESGTTIPCGRSSIEDLIAAGYVDIVEEPADEPTPVVDEAPVVVAEEPPVQEEEKEPPVRKPRAKERKRVAED